MILIQNSREYDFAGVEAVSVDRADSNEPIYDLMGRRVAHPSANQLYIRNGQKFIYR